MFVNTMDAYAHLVISLRSALCGCMNAHTLLLANNNVTVSICRVLLFTQHFSGCDVANIYSFDKQTVNSVAGSSHSSSHLLLVLGVCIIYV